jgi:hypothetical protein
MVSEMVSEELLESWRFIGLSRTVINGTRRYSALYPSPSFPEKAISSINSVIKITIAKNSNFFPKNLS